MGKDQMFKGMEVVSSNRDERKGKVLEDDVDEDKFQDLVLDSGMEINMVPEKFLKGVVKVEMFLNKDLNPVQLKVPDGSIDDTFLKGGVEVNKFQDKVLNSNLDPNTEDNFQKRNVYVDEIHDMILKDSVYPPKKVLEKTVNMKVQNKMGDYVDLTKALDEVLKNSVDVNKNGVKLNKAYDMVLKDYVNVVEVLNVRKRMNTTRCQVRITIRHNLQLRLANHTAQDVYVRLLSYGERITGSGKESYDDCNRDGC